MITKFPDDRMERAEELVASMRALIADLRGELEQAMARARADERLSVTDNSKHIAEARRLVLACQQAELDLGKEQARTMGVVQNGHAIDLEQARHEIGCRLDKLRRCYDPR